MEAQPVIVGVDRSETARRAAQTAAEMAVALGCPLHLVSAVSRTNSVNINSGDQWHSDWFSEAEQFLLAMAGEFPGKVTHSISDKGPATALCDAADELDVVLGAREAVDDALVPVVGQGPRMPRRLE